MGMKMPMREGREAPMTLLVVLQSLPAGGHAASVPHSDAVGEDTLKSPAMMMNPFGCAVCCSLIPW